MTKYMGTDVDGMWHETDVTVRCDRVVVKIQEKNSDTIRKIIMPTMYYPINGPFRTFSYNNTAAITDNGVLEILDGIKYQIGRCYTNTEAVVTALASAGYDVKSYVGWAFIGYGDTPAHHCWAVLNGESVIDLADDYTLMLSGDNRKNFEGKSTDEARMTLIDFAKWASNLKNSERCIPIGQPTPFVYYIGSECSPEHGRAIYNKLMKDYPHHEAEKDCNDEHYNKTQWLMHKAGLM